jgi:predicted TIM-barrel fold metal-dependent hydrolase
MIIDAHVHYEPEILPPERILACMDKHGIDKAALIAAANEPFYLSGSWLENTLGKVLRNCLYRVNPAGQYLYEILLDRKGNNIVLLGKKYPLYTRPDNAPVAQVVEENPDRFMGWIFINPTVEDDPVAEVERWSAHPGMVGVKAVPFWHMYPVSELDGIAVWCREHGYPMLLHLGCREGSGDFRRLPDKYPGLKIIYAHAGIPYFRKLWSYVKDKEGVYVDFSGPGYLDRKFIGKAVVFLGADKCLYGTDGPYGEQSPGEDFDYGLRKGWIETLPLSDGELEQIFSKNFEDILEG